MSRIALALLVLGCGGGGTDATGGPAVFAAYCAVCHGEQGTPTPALVARIGVRDLNAADVRARITPALVEQQVRRGSANKLMPAFEGAIGDAQIKSVAAWVASPGFPSPPAPR